MSQSSSQAPSARPSRILWQNVTTVLSAAVADRRRGLWRCVRGGWALANLFGSAITASIRFKSSSSSSVLRVMVAFVRNAMRVEPFVAP